MFGQRILILVPHADDEVVACAATISRAHAVGARVYALYLTNGCIPRDSMWWWQRKNYERSVAQRRAEAEKVAAFLGITPIGWNLRPARHLWTDLANVYSEIQLAVGAYNIAQIWLPAYEGGNPDHDGLNAIGAVLKRQLSVMEFAEYNFFDGKAHINCFFAPTGNEHVIDLSACEQNMKQAALTMYQSEKANLNYIGTDCEMFRTHADYNYTLPPHPGTLWYARHQWVPFRHPRVDFTKPAEVSAAITKFLARAS